MTFFRLFAGFLLQVIPFAVLAFYPYCEHLRFSKKHSAVLTLWLILILSTLFASIGCILQNLFPPDHTLFQAVNVLFILCLLPCLIWYLYLVRAIWQKKLFIFSFALTCGLVITSINNVICTILIPSIGYDGLPYRGWAIIILTLMTALVLPLFLLILTQYYCPVEATLTSKEYTYLSGIPLFLFLLLSVGLSFIEYEHLYNPMSLFLFFTLLVLVLVIYLIFFKMVYLSYEKLRSQHDASQVRHLLSIQEEQYRHICTNIENSRRMRHDMRHHIITLQGFLQRGQVQEANKYLEQYLHAVQQGELIELCHNPVVNMVVGYYQTIAVQENIRFNARIQIPNTLSITDIDLSVILGNLLENAIDAASRGDQDERFIQFHMLCCGQMLAITMDNGFHEEVKKTDDRYISSKPNHSGLGLRNIEAIANKYEGGVEFTHDLHVFHSSVMLAL
ncbi:MAG: GHKL domain-containing protein [Butyricicoccus pullicaecorum]|nr:GHKL domain-containing protein [Butyricicoccus pullicaecorum]